MEGNTSPRSTTLTLATLQASYSAGFRRKLAQKKNRHKFRNRIIFGCIRELDGYYEVALRAGRYSLYNVPYEALVHNIVVNTEFGRELRKAANPDALFSNFIRHKTGTIRYTDGSRIENDGLIRFGCDALRCDLEMSISRGLNGRLSIFTAESVAFRDAVMPGVSPDSAV